MSHIKSFEMGGETVVALQRASSGSSRRIGFVPDHPDGASMRSGAALAPASDVKIPRSSSRAREEPAAANVSILAMRDLWLVPFLAEVVLMSAAMWMSFCLLQVMQWNGGGQKFPVASILLLVGAYAVLALYARLHELFLPRKVVVFGVGTLLLFAAAYGCVFGGEAFLSGGVKRLANASLALAPIQFFIVRCLLVFRDARFAPSAETLAWRRRHRSKVLDRLRRKLSFWLN
jgi:hypothetical protein